MLSHAIRKHDRAAPAENGLMRVLVATDAWHPQVNGVVRTLTSLARSAERWASGLNFCRPMVFVLFQCRPIPDCGWHCRAARQIARRIEQAKPDAIHIATEGPIGHMARGYCLRRGRPFTTSYTTRFPEYFSARVPIPEGWVYAALRRFHAAAAVTMVATPSLMAELNQRGFSNLAMWTRGVDTDLFRPDRAIELDSRDRSSSRSGGSRSKRTWKHFFHWTCPAPRSLSAQGPQEAELRRRFPQAKFLGLLENGNPGRASGRRRRVRVSEPDGHVRRRAARSARERRSGCGIPGYRSEGRRRRATRSGS